MEERRGRRGGGEDRGGIEGRAVRKRRKGRETGRSGRAEREWGRGNAEVHHRARALSYSHTPQGKGEGRDGSLDVFPELLQLGAHSLPSRPPSSPPVEKKAHQCCALLITLAFAKPQALLKHWPPGSPGLCFHLRGHHLPPPPATSPRPPRATPMSSSCYPTPHNTSPASPALRAKPSRALAALLSVSSPTHPHPWISAGEATPRVFSSWGFSVSIPSGPTVGQRGAWDLKEKALFKGL